MNEFERSYRILALAYGLAEANDFKVVGEEGKKNYQLLFSKFLVMIENDGNEVLVDRERKSAVITSLKRTIAFYDTKNPEELQQIIENMKKDEPSEFMILPAYATRKSMDHVFGVILYKKENHYVVTVIDKLRYASGSNLTGTFTIILPEKLRLLSRMLFYSKDDHLSSSRCNIAQFIHRLGQEKCGYESLNLSMGGYNGNLANCPIKEIFGTFRVALYNCSKSIFIDTKATIHPKLGSTEENRRLLVEDFTKDNQEFSFEQISALNNLYKTYCKLKTKRKKLICCPNRLKGKLALVCMKRILMTASNVPVTYKKNVETSQTFKVFSLENQSSEKLNDVLNKIIIEGHSTVSLHKKRKFPHLAGSALEVASTINSTPKKQKRGDLNLVHE